MKEILITSSVLILAIMALRFVFRNKISHCLQYALWALVLVRLLCPISLPESNMSVLSGAQVLEDHIIAHEYLGGNIVLPQTPEYSDVPTIQTPVKEQGVDWSKVLTYGWLGGASVMGLWFLWVNLHLSRKLKNSRKVYAVENFPLPVYLTEHVASPCLFGLFRPAVYLTEKATASEESLRHVLTHELCHWRHKDHIVSFLRCLCLCIYWFNPLVWLAAILSKTDGELACDEAALALLGEEQRLPYGKTLVDMIARNHRGGMFVSATTMAGNNRSIRRRVLRIAHGKKTLLWAAVCVIVCVAICVGCTFTAGKTPNIPTPPISDPISDDPTPPVSDPSNDDLIAPVPEDDSLVLTHIQGNTETPVGGLSKEVLWQISQNGHGRTFESVYVGIFEHVFRIRHISFGLHDGTVQDSYCYRTTEGEPRILQGGVVRELDESLMLTLENAIGMHEPLFDSLEITRTVTGGHGGEAKDGDALEYVIAITNLTDAKIKQVEVHDVIPEHAGLSSKDGILTITGDDPRWVVDLDPHKTVTLRYKVKVGGQPKDYIFSYGGSVAGIPFSPLITYIVE